MKTEILEYIKTNKKLKSDRIHVLKKRADPHISPKEKTWKEYKGLKQYVTILLVAQHLYKSNEPTSRYIDIDSEENEKYRSHLPNDKRDQDRILYLAKKLINKLSKKFSAYPEVTNG